MLEVPTGRRCLGFNVHNEGGGKDFPNLVTWVREIMFAADARPAWRIQEIMDPMIDHIDNDLVKVELLVIVAFIVWRRTEMQCPPCGKWERCSYMMKTTVD